jgi:hypothetical protein
MKVPKESSMNKIMKSMKSMCVIIIYACVIGCILKSSSGSGPEAVFRNYDFPAFEPASHLCHQDVYGPHGEITWDTLATSAQPDQVASFYIDRLGTKAVTKDKEGWTWRFPAGSPEPERVLSIHQPMADGPWKRCREPVPSDARTIIMLSAMAKFR